MSHPRDPDEVEKLADALAWAVLADLADRAGVPEWLGSKEDGAAVAVHHEISRDVVLPRLKALWGALEPFATYAESLPPVVPGAPRVFDDEGIALTVSVEMRDYRITFGDFRRALAALEQLAKSGR